MRLMADRFYWSNNWLYHGWRWDRFKEIIEINWYPLYEDVRTQQAGERLFNLIRKEDILSEYIMVTKHR